MRERIVIPMAGESRRFSEAGYRTPKYRLQAGGRSLFSHAVGSFGAYFASLPFLFVARGTRDEQEFVERECAGLGIADFRIVLLDRSTRGQAETVSLGLDRAGVEDETPLTIFNVDTVRPGFLFPEDRIYARCDGALEVFEGEGTHWSFVRPGPDKRVAETAEKNRISNLCSTGLYRFARAGDFRQALARECDRPTSHELYVAPLFNHLIAAGKDVRYWIVNSSDVIFSGVPAEYEAFKRSYDAADGSRLAR